MFIRDSVGYSLIIGCFGFAASLLIKFGMYSFFDIHVLEAETLQPPLLMTFIEVAILSPLLETYFLAIAYFLFNLYFRPAISVVFAGALLAALHSSLFWIWGIFAFVPLLIYSIPFSNKAVTHNQRLISSAVSHATHNCLAFLLVMSAG